MSLEKVSSSEEETSALAAGLAQLLKPGDVVFLEGQLGTGKTFFIRAAARALGVTEPVTSPSFTMAQTYTGDVTIHHLDLYRLPDFGPDDAVDFEPFFESSAITFIEWPQQGRRFLEEPDVIINLEHVDKNSRLISFTWFRKDLKEGLEKLVAGTGH